MSLTADGVRKAVAKTIRFRQRRWRYYLYALVFEAIGLALLCRGPVFLILLPVLALPTLLPVLLRGRYRLPEQENQGDSDYAGQLANLRRCFGTLMYFRHRYSHAGGEEHNIEIVTKRSHRGIRAEIEILGVYTPSTLLLVTSRSYWVQHEESVHFGDTKSIGIQLFEVDQKVGLPRDDDKVLGSTWRYTTKRGEPDLRYRNNRELWQVRRYCVELALGDYRLAFNLYSHDNACFFANAFSAISKQGPALIFVDEDENAPTNEMADEFVDEEEPPLRWHEVLEVSPDASLSQIKMAYRER